MCCALRSSSYTDELVTSFNPQFNLLLHGDWILGFIPQIDFFEMPCGIVQNSFGGGLEDLVGYTFFFLLSCIFCEFLPFLEGV